MAQRKIVWTQTAARQRRTILQYWLDRNKSAHYPLNLLRLTDEKARLIAKNPFAYKAADFPDTRVATMGHYSIFYKATNDQIIITAFWDIARIRKSCLTLCIRFDPPRDFGMKRYYRWVKFALALLPRDS